MDFRCDPHPQRPKAARKRGGEQRVTAGHGRPAPGFEYAPPSLGPMMRAKQVLLLMLTAAALVFGGVLECGTAQLTETQAHGAELYGRMCSVCHGKGGEGYRAD